MKAKYILFAVLFFVFGQINAQKITKGEYFYDIDPGVGAGVPIVIISPADTINQTFSLSTASLNNAGFFKGFHQIYIRFQDSSGRWGFTDAYPFYVYDTAKITAPILSVRLNAGEYFIDVDPGVGQGIAIPSFTIGDSVYTNFSFNTAALLNNGLNGGFHQIYYRFRDSIGRWGFTDNMPFFIYDTTKTNQVVSAQLSQGEYFIDSDPGVGNGIFFNTGGLADSVQTTLNLNTSGLANGLHNLYIRFRGVDGKWGFTEQKSFRVCSTIFPSPIVTGKNSVCIGDSIKLFASSVSGAIAYRWSGPDGFSSTLQNISIPNVSSEKAGEYKVVAIGSGGTSCDTSNEVVVSVFVLPPPVTANLTVNSSLNFCEGDSVILSTSHQNGNSYRWMRNGVNTLNNTDTLSSLIVRVGGTYSVKVTNSSGCYSNMRDTLVTVSPKPITSTISGSINVLVGSTNIYTVINRSGSNYQWTVNNGMINSGNGTNSVSITWSSVSGSARIKLVETSSSGCQGDSVGLEVNISDLTLNVSPLSLVYSNSASSKKVGVSSNTSWSVSSNQPWISLNKTNGANNDSVLISVSQNPLNQQRIAKVIFTAGNLVKELIITQDSTPVVLDQLSLNKDSLLVNSSEFNTTVQLQSNRTWTITNPAPWVTISPMSGSNNAVLSVNISANTISTPRMVDVLISAGSIIKELHIKQDAAVGFSELIGSTKFSIYPNPTSGLIILNSGSIVKKIEVFDGLGKLVHQQSFQNKLLTVEIDLSTLASGLYFISAYSEYGGLVVDKVLLYK